MSSYDVIVVGAGSVGVPIALALGEKGLKILVVDKNPSPGQGENKHGIGGIRATHSDSAKIITGLRSLEIFSTWEERFGDDIEWVKGGYTFPAYRAADEQLLKGMLPTQKKYGLNIDFVGPGEMQVIVPGINPEGLMGGTFSPDDGSASPLLAISAFYRRAVELGVEFRFKEEIRGLLVGNGNIQGVAAESGRYWAPVVVDAAGPYSKDLCRTVDVDMPVVPESHEAGITEPVQQFFTSMVVDMRPIPGSKNYYFYQNRHGQVIFCLTPEPPLRGTDKRETSVFLPQISTRMVALMPRLRNLRVRRVWRGLYPMSPDGSPLVGWNREIQGLVHATGMCGQGFMLGPGLGEVIARMITHETNEEDKIILEALSPYRVFGAEEVLK